MSTATDRTVSVPRWMRARGISVRRQGRGALRDRHFLHRFAGKERALRAGLRPVEACGAIRRHVRAVA